MMDCLLVTGGSGFTIYESTPVYVYICISTPRKEGRGYQGRIKGVNQGRKGFREGG
jgi:hypothetical protein